MQFREAGPGNFGLDMVYSGQLKVFQSLGFRAKARRDKPDAGV